MNGALRWRSGHLDGSAAGTLAALADLLPIERVRHARIGWPTMTTHPANWYPDPTARHELRYYDGQAWTDHVSDNGQTSTDPLNPMPPPAPAASTTAAPPQAPAPAPRTKAEAKHQQKVKRQVQGGGWRGASVDPTSAGTGSGTIFDEPVLVVNQKAKLIELNNQYGVFDQEGNQIAAVNQVGQSTAKKVLRFVSSVDQFMTHKLEVTDARGAVLLRLTRPRKFIKSSVIVSDGNDNELGRVVQENMVGKIRFGLMVGDQRVGGIFGENWRAWNFRIENAAGDEVARITKTFEGVLKTMYTTADNYVVQIHQRQPEPVNSLIVASALSVDTALKQDARGFG